MGDMEEQPKDAGYQSFYSWKRRRRFMYAVATFCAATITYVLLADKAGSVAETVVNMAFLTLASITGAYVFGAVWQDVNFMKTNGNLTTIRSERTVPIVNVKNEMDK